MRGAAAPRRLRERRRRAPAALAVARVRRLALALYAGVVAQGRGLDRVAGAALLLPGSHRKHEGRLVPGADDRVRRPRRAVEEVPGLQQVLLALHDRQRPPAQYEEVLLSGLVVVHGHRPARLEPVQRDAQVVEVRLALAAEP